MAPTNRTKATEIEVPQQQELTSAELPISRAVRSEDYTRATGTTPGGQLITARVGMMDANQNVGAGRATDPRFESLRKAVQRRHEATGVEAATILNFLPIPLVVNSPMMDLKVRVAPAPERSAESDDFSFHIWHEPAIEVLEAGEGIKQPWDYSPVQIAEAFLNEYKDFGGVVLLRGLPTKENLARPKVQEAIKAAKETMVTWMLATVEEANGEWNTANHSGAKNIVYKHRVCATRLKDLGVIDQLPDWIVESRNLNEAAKRCPRCATLPNQGSLLCLACGEVFDPELAFMKELITEEHGALERLTRKQVIALGISAFVAETSDERPERLKRGEPKPMSLAVRRAAKQGSAEPVAAGAAEPQKF